MPRKLKFYAVADVKETSKFLTIVNTKKEAFEFGNKYLKLLHIDHFKRWCEVHNLNEHDDDSWHIYFLTVLTDEERQQLKIYKAVYKVREIASILRMFGGCNPLGCSFDTTSEYAYLNYRLEMGKKIASDLYETMQDMMESEDDDSNNNKGDA